MADWGTSTRHPAGIQRAGLRYVHAVMLLRKSPEAQTKSTSPVILIRVHDCGMPQGSFSMFSSNGDSDTDGEGLDATGQGRRLFWFGGTSLGRRLQQSGGRGGGADGGGGGGAGGGVGDELLDSMRVVSTRRPTSACEMPRAPAALTGTRRARRSCTHCCSYLLSYSSSTQQSCSIGPNGSIETSTIGLRTEAVAG